MERIRVHEYSPVLDDKTGHLRPIINFLIDQGNVPVHEEFTWDKEGIGAFLFEKPIDAGLLKKTFDLPNSIHLAHDEFYGGTTVWDSLNFLIICQVK